MLRKNKFANDFFQIDPSVAVEMRQLQTTI
jgi:hypothetical protein